MKTAKGIDWLSITIPGNRKWKNFIPLAEWELEGKGRHGYGQRWRDKRTGATIETASTRDEMGTHITLSGDVLRAMRADLGATDETIIERVREFDGKCSRVDVNIDIHGGKLTPKALSDDLKHGCAKIPARKWRFIAGHDGDIEGDAVDTGSPKSDVRFRFYDKTAEQCIKDGEAWVRLELQLRRAYAKACMAKLSAGSVAPVVAGYIGNYLAWANEEYLEALSMEASDVPEIERKEGNRKRWLLGQVAHALASELAIDPYFREKFDASVNEHLRVIVAKRNKKS